MRHFKGFPGALKSSMPASSVSPADELVPPLDLVLRTTQAAWSWVPTSHGGGVGSCASLVATSPQVRKPVVEVKPGGGGHLKERERGAGQPPVAKWPGASVNWNDTEPLL